MVPEYKGEDLLKKLVSLLFGAALVCPLLFGPAAIGQIIPGKYILILEDPPVAERFASQTEREAVAGLAYRAQIENRQAAIKRDLAGRNFIVTGSVSLLLNAIFVNAEADRVSELSAVAGVVAVRPMRKVKALLDQATTALNAPTAWKALGGVTNAGRGIKIGVIDTGIDQTHPVFQDAGLTMPPGFPKFTNGHPEDAAYTTNKVIVARSYVRLLAAGSNPSNPAIDSHPDDFSPRDRQGHGTAVASCAAGETTLTPGITSTGGAITIQGMAPKAYLGSYKVIGSPGVNDGTTDQAMIQAVEDAVLDGMDVITTSVGTPALTSTANDPMATAFENAAKTGAIVLAAAGNNGENSYNNGYSYPNFNSMVSPAIAPDVLAVGASENQHILLPAVSVISPSAPASLQAIPAQPSDTSNYPSTFGASSAPLVDVTRLGDSGTACGSLPANSLVGVFVLIENGGGCTFTDKATNAENAGAVGIVFYWADSTPVTPVTGVGQNNFTDADFFGPVVAISNAAGVALKNYIDANPGQTVSISAGQTEMDITAWSKQYALNPLVTSNMLAGFSSVGPSPEGLIKPDLLAVGGNDTGYLFPIPTDFYVPSPSGIFMATQRYDPNFNIEGLSYFSSNGYWAADGTSFATPLTAGAAALVKQAHPGLALRGTQIKSLLVNSTAQTITMDDGGFPIDTENIGSGLLDAGAAVAATITAEPSTVSFGFLNSATLPLSKTITLTNIGTNPATLTASVVCCSVNAASGTLSGATVAATLSSATLTAGGTSTLTVSLSGKIPSAGEYSGTINLQQGSTVVSRIPFMMIEGDGVAYNVNVIQLGGEGVPNQDIGPLIVQITDQFGAPVANSPAVFTVSPNGAVQLKSVANEPTCTTARANTTCTSDRYGFIYAEIINGANTTTATISSNLLGNQISGGVNIQAPPNVTGVADAAAGLTTVAPGSYVAIYGTGLSDFTDENSTIFNFLSNPTTEVTDPVVPNGAVLPLHIDFVTVSFDVPSAGISVPANIVYVSPTQINIQVPWELQGQTSAQMKVTLDGDLLGNVVTVKLSNAAPAYFSYSSGGNNIAIAQDLSFNLITPTHAASRGSIITLYANGLGPVNGQPASGNPAAANPLPTTTNPATVTIGGQNANVIYAGLVPTLPGLYQLDVTVPSGISPGSQPITLSINGQNAPQLTIPVQ
jgi:uncharacterized protein (TIGR03437 family)